MKSLRQVLSVLLVLVLSLGLLAQPGSSAGTHPWHLRWPKIQFGFDASTPFRAIGSVFVDAGRAIEGAAGYVANAMDWVGRGIESMFSSPAANASPPGDQEVVSQRTETSHTYARPDGSHYAVISTDPVNYQDAQGNWQPIDTSLLGDPTGWHSAANQFGFHFSSDSTSLQLVQITWNATSVSFGLRGAKAVTPTVAGSTITYPGVFTNTDLSFTVTSRGLIKSLKLNARPSVAPIYKVHVDVSGLSPQQTTQAVSFLNSAGAGWAMLPVWMSDSAGTLGADNAASSSIGLSWGQDSGGGYLLTVTPSSTWLTDPARVYPVTVDPTLQSIINPGLSSSSNTDTFVESSSGYVNSPQYQSADLKTGYCNDGTTCTTTKARSYLKFSMTSIPANVDVISADFNINEYWAGSCTATPVSVDKVTSSWSYNVTWNGTSPGGTPQPSVDTTTPISTLTTAVGSTCSPSEGRLDFTGLKSLVSGWLATPSTNYGISIRASETDNRSWKKFRSVDYTSTVTSDAPALVVNYNTIPTATASSPTASAWTNSPKMTWNYSDDDTQKNFDVQISTSSSFTTTVQDSGSVASSANNWSATAALTTGTTYYWRVKVYDGTDWSAWTSAAAFRWDGVLPAGTLSTPANESTVSGTITLTAVPTDANSGIKQVSFFSTQLGTKKLITTVTSGWTTTLDTTTLSDGRAVISAEVTDVAGNLNDAAGGAAVIVKNATPAPESWVATASADGLSVTGHMAEVALGTGQLLVPIHEEAVPGRGFDANFARGYNSASTMRGILGPGWRSSPEEDVIPSYDGSVTQIDPTGHQRRFTPTSSTGLDATFYNNTTLTGTPVLTRVDPQVNFAWAGASPGTGVTTTNWSARWRGLISVPTAGSWTFYCSSDDGCRVWVDGVPVIDDWKTQPQTEVTGSVTLGAGSHELIMEYYQAASTSALVLSWAGPGITKQVIPAANLLHADSFTAPAGIYDTLARNASDGSFTITDKSGLVRHFTATGYRDVNTDPSGNTYTIAYDSSTRPQYVCISVSPCNATNAKITYAYDANGRLQSVSDPLPRSWTFAYDASGRLSTVTDPLTDATTYGYDASGRLNSITDAQGDQARVTYDASGRVASVQSARSVAAGGPSQTFSYAPGTATVVSPKANALIPAGAGTSYTLGSSGELLSSTDPLGDTSSQTYDANFNVLTGTDALNKVTHFTYDSRGNLLTQTDPLNHAVTNTYDSLNDLLTSTDQRGKTTTFTYDGARNRLSQIDPLGDRTTYTYDANGLMLTQVDPRGNVSGADPTLYTTSYTYDPLTSHVASETVGKPASPVSVKISTYDVVGDQLSQGDSLTPAATATYDKAGNILTHVDGAGDKTSYTYDKANREQTDVNPEGNLQGNLPAAYATTYSYYADGLPNTTTDPLQRVESSTFDWDGNQIVSTDAEGNQSTANYDLVDRLTSTQDATGLNTTTHTYDADGRTTRVTDSKGTSTNTYDDAGRLIAVEGPRFASDGVTPLKTTYAYDAAGNVLTTTSPAGNVSGAAPGSYTTTNTYDDNGRLIMVTDPAGNVTTYGYDAASNRTSVVDPIGTTTTYAYDALNREVQSNMPGTQALQASGSLNASGTSVWTGGFTTAQTGLLSGALSWATAGAGMRLELLNSTGSVIATATAVTGGPESLTYNSAPGGSYTWRVTATSGSSTFTLDYSVPTTEIRSTVYDVAGRATSTTDALGTTHTTYDNADRPSTITLPSGSPETFTYWADGLPNTQTDSTGTQTSTFDTARQPWTQIDQGGITTTYGYDLSGNPTSVARSSGPGSSSSGWDMDNRLCVKAASGTPTCTNPSSGSDRFAYTDNINRTVTTHAFGDVDTRSYDQGNLVSEAKSQPSQTGAPSTDLGYVHDAEGNVSNMRDLVSGSTPGTYTYDVLNRLTSETLLIPGQSKALTLTYSYDGESNRTQLTSRQGGPTTTTSFTYNGAGQLARMVPSSGAATTYIYDQAGNLLRGIAPNGTTGYAWNSQGFLSQVSLPSGTNVSFTYGASGVRRTKVVGSATTTYSYEGGNLVSETGPSGTASYTYDESGAPLTITLPSGSTYTYRYDGHGSTIELTDASHFVAATYTYDAWGNVLAQSGDATLLSANPYTYLGQLGVRYDSDTGLFLTGARYYDPSVGRFISRDPVSANPAQSSYVYADDNPSSKEDSSGLFVPNDSWGSPAPLRLPWPKGIGVTFCSTCGYFFGDVDLSPKSSHHGVDLYAIDFPLKTGTSIVASQRGTVVCVGMESGSSLRPRCPYANDQWKTAPGYGWRVIIQDNTGGQTLYAHLCCKATSKIPAQSSIVVRPGQLVTQGQLIAKSDCTGKCFGPHLHWSNRWSTTTARLPVPMSTANHGMITTHSTWAKAYINGWTLISDNYLNWQ